MSGRLELNGFVDLYRVALENKSALDKNALSPALAFNALCSINHLVEWLKKDPSITEDIKKSASGLFHSYDTQNETLNVIRELCNAQKHYGILKNTPQTNVASGYGVGRFGVGLYGVGEPSYAVEVNGKQISFLDLINEAIKLWNNFVESNGLR